jgi:hypothetical protein
MYLTWILDTSLGGIVKKELVEPPSPSTPSPMDQYPVVPPRIIQGTPGGYDRGVASSIQEEGLQSYWHPHVAYILF